MNRPCFFLLLSYLPGLTLAEFCTGIEDDARRLACFDATSRCASIESDAERLACLDRAYVGAGNSPARVPYANPAASRDSEPVATVTASSPDEFGKRNSPDAPREHIEATIVEVRSSGLKIDYLRLDNGQIWREIEDSRIRFRKGRRVTISEGVMNSFDLKMDGANRIVKVRRLE